MHADPCGLQLLLGLADPGDLWRRVDHPWNRVEIHVRLLAGDALGHRHALLLRLVSEHRSAHHVADRPHVGKIRAAILIDGDKAALVEPEPHAFGVETARVGHAADGDDKPVEGGALRLALRVGVFDGHVFLRLHAGDPDAELDLEFLLGENLPGFFRDLLVGSAEENRQRLEDRHLRSEAAPDAAHLQADDAGAYDAEALGNLGNFERPGVAEDQLLVESRPRERTGIRAGGDDDVPGRQGFVLRALDRYLAAVRAGLGEAAAAVKERDLVLLEEIDDAVVVGLDHLVLALEHLGEIELEALHAHAVIGEVVPGLLEVLGGLQQGLGRDAADVGARAPQRGLAVRALPLVHAGGLEAELRGADRGDVTARPAADDYDVKRLSHEVIGKSIRPLPAPLRVNGLLQPITPRSSVTSGRRAGSDGRPARR